MENFKVFSILFLGHGPNLLLHLATDPASLFFFSPHRPNSGSASGQHTWPMPAWLGLHCPHDEQSPSQAHAAAMRENPPLPPYLQRITCESKWKMGRTRIHT
jgi:hypothetical protein